jgi:hypothetical protein
MNENHLTQGVNPDPSNDDLRVVAELEKLDDIIYPAIDGDETALEAVGPAWEQALTTLGPEAVQESRREYLRHARATWDFLRKQTLQRPHHIIALANILLLLSGDDGG